MNAIELEDLTKRFGSRTAVDHLDLQVPEGAVFGFLGRNGAGKSTTIKMMLGLVRPDTGTVRLMGYDLNREHDKALENVGALVERPAFYNHLSGYKNLELLARRHSADFRRRMIGLAERLGIADRLDDRVGAYSQGMKQKLALVLSLLPDSRLLVLDEPTNGLDPHSNRGVRDFLQELGQSGDMTILLSSHLLSEVEQVCTRLVVLELGKLIAQGRLEDLLAPPDEVEVVVDRALDAIRFIESIPGCSIKASTDSHVWVRLQSLNAADLNARLVAAGYRVQELRPLRRTLEEYFLNLTDSALDTNLPD